MHMPHVLAYIRWMDFMEEREIGRDLVDERFQSGFIDSRIGIVFFYFG